jgi:hypothetical protein
MSNSLKNREKNARGKPHAFQNGFVANRIARSEAPKYPDAEIKVVVMREGKGRIFLIEKEEGGRKTYWISPNDGFRALEGDVA